MSIEYPKNGSTLTSYTKHNSGCKAISLLRQRLRPVPDHAKQNSIVLQRKLDRSMKKFLNFWEVSHAGTRQQYRVRLESKNAWNVATLGHLYDDWPTIVWVLYISGVASPVLTGGPTSHLVLPGSRRESSWFRSFYDLNYHYYFSIEVRVNEDRGRPLSNICLQGDIELEVGYPKKYSYFRTY